MFDTSIAQEILTQPFGCFEATIAVASINLKNKKDYEAVVDYIYKADRDAFGACFQRGFIADLLKSDQVRCLVACDRKNEIVGILWGFLANYQGTQLFHTWELSRKPAMAQMGIARKLIDHAREEQSSHASIKYVTLNVDHDNVHAKQIYDQEAFEVFNQEKKNHPKIFMINKLTKEDVQLKLDLAQTLVKKFVMDTIPLYKLVYYELVRRCELVWRMCWYR